MNVSPNLTFKQQRFVEEYQVDSNGTQAVLRAGYQTKHPAEMAYGLSEILRSNIPSRMPREPVESVCKCG